MVRYYTSRLTTYSTVPSTTDFLKRHKPLAFDDGGNDFWIGLENGDIYVMDWKRYREGAMQVATSFREFVTKFWIGASATRKANITS